MIFLTTIFILVVARKIISIRQSLASGQPSQWAFSRQVGKLEVDSRLYLGTGGHGGDLKKQVSEFVFSKQREKRVCNKKTDANPFILKISRMDQKTPRIGPRLPTLPEILRIL